MKILMVGVWSPDGTNTPLHDAFEALGHDVTFYNFANFGTFNFVKPLPIMEAEIIQLAKAMKPDLIFFCKIEGFDPDFVATLSYHWHTHYWFMDPMSTAIAMGAKFLATRCRTVSATSSEVAKFLRGGHIIEGYDPNIFHRLESSVKPKAHRVSFVGSIDNNREHFLSQLKTPVHVVESGFSYEKINELYNDSAIVLNFVRDPYIVSDRVVQILASGALPLSQISHDLVRFGPHGGIENYNKFWQYFSFVSVEELNARIDNMLRSFLTYHSLLDNFPISNYTWESQAQKVLDYIGAVK